VRSRCHFSYCMQLKCDMSDERVRDVPHERSYLHTLRQVVVYRTCLTLGLMQLGKPRVCDLKKDVFAETNGKQICNLRIGSFQMQYRMSSGQALRFGAAVLSGAAV